MSSLRSLLACAVFTAAALPHAFGLTLVGSDLLQPVLQDALQQFSADSGVPVELDMQGSNPALEAVESGDAPLALVALPRGERPPQDLESSPFAFLVTVVAVHRDNPVTEMSYNDLIEAFGRDGVAESWDAFVDEGGAWSVRKLSQHVVGGTNTVGQEIFKVEVLGDREMRSGVKSHPSLDAFVNETHDNLNVLAIIPTTRLPESLRAVPVAEGNSDRAFSPSPENALYGDYPLQLPFYLVYRRDFASTSEGKELLRFLFSDDLAEVLSEADLLPLIESERQERLRRLQ
ncbi:MAG: ABC-type phosphate transport system periplasmic component-like protein [Puniceicoccaceae bacterium 5H]|nr:MAG: ABC-type phosphate transport system periplasmic component-like protein [Puniceicoccaceae bacterium 5H]